jgi:16S rRNA (guanine966-N2)-methyltransferase
MRIIAGEFRGRVLLPPEGDVTRPVTDRVKQSVFDILAPLIPNQIVYDCFAGTGSMGLECISRGAERAIFFEADRSALTRLRKNIDALKVAERSQIVAGDLFKWLANSPAPARRAGLIFLDPPYRYLREKPDALAAAATDFTARHLAPGGLIVFRHDAKDALPLPTTRAYDAREYGGMTVEFLISANDSPGDG